MWKIGIPKLETAFNLSVGPCLGGELRAVAALAGCPWWCHGATPEPHCQPHYLLSPSPLHIPVKDIKMHRAGLSDFQMTVYLVRWGQSSGHMRPRSRLIVMFLSSSNSESLGIEFKWVTWRCRGPDAACWDFAKLTASWAQPCLGLSSSLQIPGLDTNSGSNGSIFHSSALVTSPNLTRLQPPPPLTPRRVWVMTNTAPHSWGPLYPCILLSCIIIHSHRLSLT